MWQGGNLTTILAMQGRHRLLRQLMEKIPLEEFASGDYGTTPLEAAKSAQAHGLKEVAQLLKDYKHQASRSSGGRSSGLRAFLRSGLGKSRGR